MEASVMSANDLLKKLRFLVTKPLDEVPKGFFPAPHYAKEWGMSISQTKRLLDSGAKHGVLTVKRLRVRRPKCAPRLVAHYAEK